MLLLSDIKIKDLYFVIYKTEDVNILSFLDSGKNLFFDVFMVEDPKTITYYFSEKIEKIIPAKLILELYRILEKHKKNCIIFANNENIVINEEDIDFDLMMFKRLEKKEIENFIYFLKMIKEREVEPIYLPSSDKDKEFSFIK